MTSKPHFWAEHDMVMSETATLTIAQASAMAECFFRDATTSASDRLAAESTALLTDLLPAIREARTNRANRAHAKLESAA